MIQKKGGVFLGSLFLVVFLFGVVGAQDGCWVETGGEATCENAPGGQVIMGLSGTTNAHGELKISGISLNYPTVLCCNFGNGIQPAGCKAASTDNVLFLSSATNAHAEIPEGTTYTTEVCYENMACVSTNPPETHNAILSLSDTTNAHIGGPDDYDTKIYCQVEFLGTNLCVGGAPNNIREGSEECDNDQDPHCTNFCECEVGYIYNAFTKVCEFQAAGTAAYWSDNYTTLIGTNQIDVVIGTTKAYMVLTNLGRTAGETLSFEIYEDNTAWPNTDVRIGIESIDVVVENPNLVRANWTISYSDIEKVDNCKYENDCNKFYFKVLDSEGTLIADSREYHDQTGFGYLDFDKISSVVCTTISLCMDYGQDSCESDICSVSTLSVELNSDIKCDDEGITCECWWDETEGTCNSRWVASGIGSCKNSEGITEECTAENLFFKYSWTADWTWAEGNSYDYDPNGGKYIEDPEGTWHHDPDSLSKQCVGGSNVVPCPAQIQLPFINIYNLIAIIVVIILIYFLLNLKKKKKRKVSKKKK